MSGMRTHSIYSSTFLVKLNGPFSVQIVETKPSDALSHIDSKEFFACCWPFDDKIVDVLPNSCIFSFNCSSTDSSKTQSDFNFHVLFFIYEDSAWEIIISTQRPFAQIFRKFLEECYIGFDSFPQEQFPPSRRMEYVNAMLAQWPIGAIENAVLPFPTEAEYFTFYPDYFTYMHFHPIQFFDQYQMKYIWISLFTGSPIIIHVPDAVLGSKVIYSCFSLLTPLSYDDDSIVWLRENDPRIQDENILSKYKVIATNSNKFDDVHGILKVKIDNSTKKKKHPKDENTPEYFSKLTTNCLIAVLNVMNELLMNDPYADFVNTPIPIEQIKKVLKGKRKTVLPEASDFLAFTKTKTFKKWRRSQANRNDVRQSILSFTPKQCNFSKRSFDDLQCILEGIEEFKVTMWKDAHLQAVLSSHEQKLLRAIQKLSKPNT